ncbi:MAG: molybdopterin-guanine dinucleotide biosynthesis protein B [Myxococcota bacterium]
MGTDGPPVAVAVVGHSGSGKTSLLEELIPALSSRGLALAVVKHASHGFEADRPGKDSHRLYGSGAGAVALVSGAQLATFARREADRDPCLEEALAALPDGLDLVLVEGFSWEAIPRIVVLREGPAPPREHTGPGEVLRIVRVAEPAPGSKPAFAPSLIEFLAALLERRARRVVPLRGRDELPISRKEAG